MNASIAETIKSFTEQIQHLIPEDMQGVKDDLEKNIRIAVESTFKQMDLVTREEFDTQTAVLQKTRLLVEELKQKVAELEAMSQNDA